jgi:hypothetical protein
MPLSQLTAQSTALRVLLYFGIAFAFLAVCSLLVFLSVRTGVTDPGKWIFLGVYTAVLLWAVVGTSKEHWHHAGFWGVVAGLLALHLSGFVALLRYYPTWRPLWYIPVVIVEAGLFALILSMLFSRKIR